MFRSGSGFALLLTTWALGCSTNAAPPVDHTCDGLAGDQLATAPRAVCPDDLPSDKDCGGKVPSYQSDVSSTIAARCGTCHGPGGIEAALPLSTHAQLYDQRRTGLNQIFTCLIPPACAMNLSSDERATLLLWLVCGSLDN